MSNFTTKQASLFYCYTIDEKQIRKINEFLLILEKSGVAELIKKAVNEQNFGRPGLDPFCTFAVIVYGFAMGSSTLRELESSCKNDVRFMYIMNGVRPNYSTFSKYINKVFRPYADEIFSTLVAAYLKRCGLDCSECHIDGTKFEAKPNKYKVVWKPTTFHLRLSDKTRGLLSDLKLSRGIPTQGIISATLLAKKLEETENLPIPSDIKEQKILRNKIQNLSDYLTKALEYEEKEKICGENRYSYYKTDHDATAMCLKADYYSGLGSNIHAAYQMQSVVSHGFIVSYFVSQDRTDIHTFIPTLERFYSMYGTYPRKITADSGYGCFENYEYCQKHHIEAYVKYPAWQGECSARKPALYELNTDNTIICLGGQPAKIVDIPGRHHKIKGGVFFKVTCPADCPFMPYCRQYLKEPIGSERIFEISLEYQRLKQQARDRLLSVKGIEMRVNRSCQIEGIYGMVKYNMGYGRIRRIGIKQVSTEYMLTALGLNTRKLFRFLDGKGNFKYWEAPKDLIPEKFKKPSAKRLADRVRKKKMKQPNEIARDSYKYKYRR